MLVLAETGGHPLLELPTASVCYVVEDEASARPRSGFHAALRVEILWSFADAEGVPGGLPGGSGADPSPDPSGTNRSAEGDELEGDEAEGDELEGVDPKGVRERSGTKDEISEEGEGERAEGAREGFGVEGRRDRGDGMEPEVERGVVEGLMGAIGEALEGMGTLVEEDDIVLSHIDSLEVKLEENGEWLYWNNVRLAVEYRRERKILLQRVLEGLECQLMLIG